MMNGGFTPQQLRVINEMIDARVKHPRHQSADHRDRGLNEIKITPGSVSQALVSQSVEGGQLTSSWGYATQPACRLHTPTFGGGGVVLANGADEDADSWATESFDPFGFHAASAASIIPTIPGVYEFEFSVAMDCTAAGYWYCFLRLNGTQSGRFASEAFPASAVGKRLTVKEYIRCNGTTDAVTCRVNQLTGADRNALTGDANCVFACKRIGD